MAKDAKMYYLADDIQKIQVKTNMYINEYGPAGAFHLCREIVQNNFDECLDEDSPGKTITLSYDIETDIIEIHKKKFEPLSSLIKKLNDQDNIISKSEQKEKDKHKVQSNGLTPHDEEMIDLAQSTTYRSDKNKYLKAVDTDKARKIIEYIFSDNDIKWED